MPLPKPNTPWALPKDLQGSGFDVPSEDMTLRLVISVAAHEKSGKTHFALNAPDPIGYLGTDVGDEGVIEKFIRRGIKIARAEFRPASDLIKLYTKPGSKADDGLKAKYDVDWQKYAGAYAKLLASPSIRTIVMDTATEGYELLKLARFGKLTQVKPFHYGPVNDEYRAFIRQIFNTDKNLIMIHKVKKQYAATGKKDKDGEDKDAWNGEWELAGYADTKYLAQVNVQTYREGEDSDGDFCLRVLDCRQNADLAGMEFKNEEASFKNLAAAVFENDPKDWE